MIVQLLLPVAASERSCSFGITPASPFLNKTLTWCPPAVLAVVSSSDESSTEQRLRLLQDLLAKRLITPAEFKNKRQRVLGSL